MIRPRLHLLVLLSGVLTLAQSVQADFLLTEILDPSAYPVNAGVEFTVLGYFTTSDSLTYQHIDGQDFLFGLTSTSPHLGIVGGSVSSSQDFSPPLGGAYFEDIFGGDYFGPTEFSGPTTTPDSDLSTFLVPGDVLPGTYIYSYGAEYLPTSPFSSGQESFYAFTLTVVPTPEPSTIALFTMAVGAVVLKARGRLRK